MFSLSLFSIRNIVISGSTFLLIFLILGGPVSAAGSADFNVKITAAGDETYNTSVSNVSYFNTDITFQFVESSTGGPTEYSLNLPTGFLYQSRNTLDNTCANFVVQNASNNNYYFSFSGAVGCLAKTEFTYRVTSASTPGNQSVFLLLKNGSSWSNVADVSIGITSTNSITQAVTADLNANGYIDAYKFSFATLSGVTANSLSGVTIAGVMVGTATTSGSSWILPFSDNILGTGDTPQISGVFDGVPLINESINESDGAAPRIMTIGGMSTAGGVINIGTGALTMGTSEPLAPSSTGFFSFKLGVSLIAGMYTLTGNLSTLIFTPISTLLPGTYSLSNTPSATDWSAGANILSQTLPGLIITAPIVVPPPSGGSVGGSPSPDSCPTGDLSGNFYDNKCSTLVTGTGTVINTGSTHSGSIITPIPVAPWIPGFSASPADLSASTLDIKYFTSLTEARKYLLERITNRAIIKLINVYGDKLVMVDESYFLSIDPALYGEYNKAINAYVLLFFRIQDAVSGNKSVSVKSDGRLAVNIVTSGITLVKNLLNRYVIRDSLSEKNITLYRTKNPLLAKPLSILENKVITKFDILLKSGVISEDEYDQSIQAYNDFILHLMIYRDYEKNLISKERALNAAKIFLTTYKKKMIEKGVEPSLSEELEKKQKEYDSQK